MFHISVCCWQVFTAVSAGARPRWRPRGRARRRGAARRSSQAGRPGHGVRVPELHVRCASDRAGAAGGSTGREL